jgi:membrane-associated phospholipid phosphatase
MTRLILLSIGMFCFFINGFSQSDTSSSSRNDSIFNRDNQLKNDTVSSLSTNSLPLTPSAIERDKKRIYKLKPVIDVPLTAAASAWTLYAFGKIYDRDSSSVAKIESLNTSSIPRFDRWAADVYSEKAADASDLFFYGSMPLPIIVMLADGKMRKDFGKLAFLYLEAMSVTGVIYSGSSYLTSRYRPYAYNPEAPMSLRTRGGAKNSFFAGHVALVGTSTFFIAKVFSDYHPESTVKWIPYTVASLATAATGYLRHRGGRHFPSDILIGTAVGPLVGILVPHFHKNKSFEGTGLSITPFTGRSHGLSLVYTFDKKNKKLF